MRPGATQAAGNGKPTARPARERGRRPRSWRIGELARLTGLTPDTLRYYERLRLIGPIARTPSGVRRYDEADLDRLRFIQRARTMGFSLGETAELLALRSTPRLARGDARSLVARKRDEVKRRLEALSELCAELDGLLERCQRSRTSCPILDGLGEPAPGTGRRRRRSR